MERCEIEKIGMCFVARDIKPLLGNVNPESCNECEFKTDTRIINIFKNIKNAERLEEFYGLRGDCGILAWAMKKILGGGHFVAVGEEGRAEGYMEHAALQYKGMLLDVNGINKKDSWIENWSNDKKAIFMDEVAEHDIIKGTCPRNTREKYLRDLSAKFEEKNLPQNALEFLKNNIKLYFISALGAYLLLFYFEKRLNPDFIRDIINLLFLKIADGVTTRYRKLFITYRVEDAKSHPSISGRIDKEVSDDITRAMLFSVFAVSILHFYSVGINDNLAYSGGMFFIYLAFSSAVLFNLLSIFRLKKR
jgi:hypothetical protein